MRTLFAIVFVAILSALLYSPVRAQDTVYTTIVIIERSTAADVHGVLTITITGGDVVTITSSIDGATFAPVIRKPAPTPTQRQLSPQHPRSARNSTELRSGQAPATSPLSGANLSTWDSDLIFTASGKYSTLGNM